MAPSPLININMEDIERMEVLNGNSSSIYGARATGGVVLLYSKTGEANYSKESKALSKYTIKGFEINKDFYNSKINNIKSYKSNSDSVIYWNPNISINKKNEAKIIFYTKKEVKEFQIIIDALSNNGTPGFLIKSFPER
jgi:hypothetical protein